MLFISGSLLYNSDSWSWKFTLEGGGILPKSELFVPCQPYLYLYVATLRTVVVALCRLLPRRISQGLGFPFRAYLTPSFQMAVLPAPASNPAWRPPHSIKDASTSPQLIETLSMKIRRPLQGSKAVRLLPL